MRALLHGVQSLGVQKGSGSRTGQISDPEDLDHEGGGLPPHTAFPRPADFQTLKPTCLCSVWQRGGRLVAYVEVKTPFPRRQWKVSGSSRPPMESPEAHLPAAATSEVPNYPRAPLEESPP